MLTLFSLCLTIGVYLAAKWLYQQSNNLFLSPLVLCPVILIAVLTESAVPYAAYNSGGHFLSFMLEPATVAMAVPMYKYRMIIKKYIREILISVTGGAMVAIITSVGAADQLGINSQITSSLAPRSITTPMAMNVSQMLGGNPTITAIFVIITGIMGVFFTSILLKLFPIKRSITKGMMFGITAHGTGIAKAYEFGSLEGAVASIAMVLMGLITTIIAPLLVPSVLRFFG
jgi:predicted murein hydrolase (TIGR00659 family)